MMWRRGGSELNPVEENLTISGSAWRRTNARQTGKVTGVIGIGSL